MDMSYRNIGYAQKYYLVFPADSNYSGSFGFTNSNTDHFSSVKVAEKDSSSMDYRVDNMDCNNDWTFFNSVMWI